MMLNSLINWHPLKAEYVEDDMPEGHHFYSLSATHEHESTVVHWSVTVSKFEVM
jgi:hypothetical protein